MKLMFFVVEINLILWWIVFGQLLSTIENVDFAILKNTVTIGLIFAAVVQHWAYYNLYKKSKINKIKK